MQMRIDVLSIPIQVLNDSLSMSHRLSIFHGIVDGLCDFIARCTLVRINHCTYHLFQVYSLKFSQRYTVVGSCGVKISLP